MPVTYRLEPCRTALNRVRGMPFDWSLNPYMGCVHRCTFCYVRSFERRAERPWDDRYGASIRVKTNVAEVLRTELARPSWARATVVVGAATDPYQPAEGRFRLTRACLEALADAANPIGVITRGPLIVRDRDVLAAAARRARVTVNVSVPTLDPDLWRATEPGTAPPRQRLRAVRMLAEAGVRVVVALAPIIPGLTDAPGRLAEVAREARAAGAAGLWAGLLHLQPGTREHFLESLGGLWPAERDRLAALFRGRDYLPAAMQGEASRRVADLVELFPRAATLPPLLRPAPRREDDEPPLAALQLGLGL